MHLVLTNESMSFSPWCPTLHRIGGKGLSTESNLYEFAALTNRATWTSQAAGSDRSKANTSSVMDLIEMVEDELEQD